MPVGSSCAMISCLRSVRETQLDSDEDALISLIDLLPDEVLFLILKRLNGVEIQRCRLVCKRFNAIYLYNYHRWDLPEISVNVGINWYSDDEISLTIRSINHTTDPSTSSTVLISRPQSLVVQQAKDVSPRLSLNFYKQLLGFVRHNSVMQIVGKTRKGEYGRLSVRNIDEALKIHFQFLSERFRVHFDEINFNNEGKYIPLFVKTFLASTLRVRSVRSTIKTHSAEVDDFFQAIYKRGCLNYSVVDVSNTNLIERVPLRNFNCVLMESNIPWEMDFFLETAKRWRSGEIDVGALLVVHGNWCQMEDHLREMMLNVDPQLEKDWEGCWIRRPLDKKVLRFERFRAGGNYDNCRTVLYLYHEEKSLTTNRYDLYKALRENPKFAYSRGILTR